MLTHGCETGQCDTSGFAVAEPVLRWTIMSETAFEKIDEAMSSGGVDAALATLAEELRASKSYHQLLDARLMQCRRALGLPVVLTELDQVKEPTRSQLEDKYLEVCDEIGWLFLEAGQVRDAWNYLRTSDSREKVAEAIRKIEPNDENIDEVIDVALREGVEPGYGFQLMMKHYGTCPSVTSLETELSQHSPAAQQEIVGILVESMHAELLENCLAHVEQEKGEKLSVKTLAEVVALHPWITAEGNYHTDTSHLAAAVRFCRSVQQKSTLELAVDLTEYGRTLAADYQFESEEPFTDTYESHGLFYAAQLGDKVDEALAYFKSRAEGCEIEMIGSLPVEAYIVLLARLGRLDEAIDATINMIPQGVHTTGFAPSLLELSREAGDYSKMLAACRTRGDVVAFAAALAEAEEAGKTPK